MSIRDHIKATELLAEAEKAKAQRTDEGVLSAITNFLGLGDKEEAEQELADKVEELGGEIPDGDIEIKPATPDTTNGDAMAAGAAGAAASAAQDNQPNVDTSAGANAQAGLGQNDTSSDQAAAGQAGTADPENDVATNEPGGTSSQGQETQPEVDTTAGNDGSDDAVGSEEDPDATDPRGDQTNPPANTKGGAAVPDTSNADAMAAGQAGAAAAQGQEQPDAVDAQASAGGSLLGRKLDTTTANLMKAYNDGGKKAMPEIRNLQTALSRLGFDPNGLDGKYGQGTYAAVQAFQKANGLSVDGQAGPDTMSAIKKALDDAFNKSQVTKSAQDNQAAADDAMGDRAEGGAAEEDPAPTEPAGDLTGVKPDSNEPVVSRLRIRQTIAPEVEKLLQLASKDFSGYVAIMEGKGLAEALDPPQKAQLQKYLDQIRASAERDPKVNQEFGDLISRMEKALGINKTIKQTGGDGPEEINPDDEAQDIANVKAIQARQAAGDDSAAQNQAQADDAQRQGDATYANDPQATDTRDGDDLGTAPTAPRISDELGVNINQNGQASTNNFNLPDFKSKGFSLDAPDKNNPGFVVRLFGTKEDLEQFKKERKIQGKVTAINTQQAGVPDAERDARERGVQVAEKEENMKKSVNEASMNISMNGNSAAEVAELIGILKNAGIEQHSHSDDTPAMSVDRHDDMVSKMSMMDEPAPDASPCGMEEEGVEEDWDNSPDESYADHQTMTHDLSGGINRQKPKGSERVKDPAVALETSIRERLWAALNEKVTEGSRGKKKKSRGGAMEDVTTEGSRGKKKSRGGAMEEGSRGKKKSRGTMEGSRGKTSRGKKSRG